MLTIALATLRTRWVSFTGAFLALALGSAVTATMIMALTATSATPYPGPQRFAAAPTVVVPYKTVRLSVDGVAVNMPVERPGGLSTEVLAQVAATGETVLDRSFPVHLTGSPAGRVGHAWSAAAFTPYRLVAGRAPAADSEIVLGGGDPTLVGRQIDVTAGTGGASYTVTGVTAAVWFEHAIFFTDAAAARISPDVNAAVAYGAADSVRRAASTGAAQVFTGDARGAADPDPSGGKDQLSDAEAMAATSFILGGSVAVFVVIATFSFVTEQRRRELALLRIVGATPRQVRRIVLTEAAVVGVVASAVGCALGTLAVPSLNTWMVDHGVAPAWFTIDVTFVATIIAFAVGLAAAVLGAAAAAWRAARVRPVEALRGAAVEQRVMTLTRWLLATVLLAVGAYESWTTITDSPGDASSVRDYLPAFMPLVGGFALLAPIVGRPVAHLATWPLRRLGAGSMVVRANVLTAGRRTAATVAPVVLALGLSAAMLAVQGTADDSHNAATRRQNRADFIVVPTQRTDISAQTAAAIRAVPGTTVTVFTSVRIRLATESDAYIDTFDAVVVDPATLIATQHLEPVAGSLSSLDDEFLVIDQVTARRHRLNVGDRLRAYQPDGTAAAVRIAAEIDSGVDDETLYLSAVHAAGGLPTRIDVRLNGAADRAAVAAALRAAVRDRGAQVGPANVYLDKVRSQQQSETRQAITVILGVALLYCLIAVANTMVIAAAGRRREIAAMRLAGATRRQLLRFAAAESILVVLIGAILATVAAAAAVVGQQAALSRLSGDVPVSIPWLLIGEIAATCAAVAVAAAVLTVGRLLHNKVVDLAGVPE